MRPHWRCPRLRASVVCVGLTCDYTVLPRACLRVCELPLRCLPSEHTRALFVSCMSCSCVILLPCWCAQTEGVKKIHDVGPMSAFEQDTFNKMVPELEASIVKGVKFVRGQ